VSSVLWILVKTGDQHLEVKSTVDSHEWTQYSTGSSTKVKLEVMKLITNTSWEYSESLTSQPNEFLCIPMKCWWSCSNLYTDWLQLTVTDRCFIVVLLVIHWRTTNRQRSCVQLSHNWKIDGTTYRTTSWSVVQLLAAEADWLHSLSLGGIAAGLYLIVRFVAYSSHRWHDYPLLWWTKFMWSCNHAYHQSYDCPAVNYNLPYVFFFKLSQYVIASENHADWSYWSFVTSRAI
jgi:hypothetical protein